MESESLPILQLPLFVYGESISNVVELFPAMWKATESLTAPDPATRQRGLDALIDVGAQKVSPLVAYMIATRVNDPELKLREKVIHVLAEILARGSNLPHVPDDVRGVVNNYLHDISGDTVLGLLEVSIASNEVDRSIFQLLNACPFGGKYLGEIVSQWKYPLPIRQKAIYFIGEVGYLETLPVLERLLNRLEARMNGQYSMDFAPQSNRSDEELYSYLHTAVTQLTAR